LPPLFATPKNKEAPKLFIISRFGALLEVPGGAFCYFINSYTSKEYPVFSLSLV